MTSYREKLISTDSTGNTKDTSGRRDGTGDTDVNTGTSVGGNTKGNIMKLNFVELNLFSYNNTILNSPY